MKEPEDELWAQLFQDKEISSVSLERFQTQLMAEITANPVNFSEEILLDKRRKWGLGVALTLFVLGMASSILIWFKGAFILQRLDSWLFMIGEWSYVLELQQAGHRIVQNLMLIIGHKAELGHLWGTFSGPLLGIFSVFVVLRSSRPWESRLF